MCAQSFGFFLILAVLRYAARPVWEHTQDHAFSHFFPLWRLMGWSRQFVQRRAKQGAFGRLIRLRDIELRPLLFFAVFDFLSAPDTPLPPEEAEVLNQALGEGAALFRSGASG